MKITKAVASKNAATIQSMSGAQQKELEGLTINEAIARGLITDLGDDEGNFIKSHADENIDAHYAIVNGAAVRCSSGVADALDTIPEQIGDLTFQAGVSNVEGEGFGKNWFRLTLPKGLKLGETAVKLALEPVNG